MSRPHDRSLRYLPGIDALRALAVLAVFFYHAGVEWMPGGFLGVDVFFTISGFLITSLLLGEFGRRGHLSVGKFWARRARRLLPAVGVFVAVMMIVAAIVEPEQMTELRGDAVASLAYVANWHFIFDGQPYFEQFQRPSLFRHLWSLSVEEQFYLFWPLLFAAGMVLFGRRRLLLGVLAGALASVALAWILFDSGADVSRIYYGTDTHAVGLLAGVALAFVWSPLRLGVGVPGRLPGPLLDGVGAVALGGILLLFVSTHDYDLSLYHGRYALLALLTAALLAALAHPATRLGGLLGRPAALWLGVRSYSFYLWHWPVLMLTRPGIDVSLAPEALIPLQLLAVLALAELSYRFVELPFQGKAPLPAPRLGGQRLRRAALFAAAVVAVFVVGWSGLVSSRGERPVPAAASTASVAKIASSPVAPAAQGTSGDRVLAASRPADPAPPTRPLRVIALGDSVMVGAADQLARRLGPRFSIDARVGRQADEFVAIAQRLKDGGHHPDAMIVHIGNNGPLYGEEMKALHEATRNVGELVLVSSYAPVSWQDQANGALAEADDHWSDTTLVDWHSSAASNGDLTWDGIHLTPAGAALYSRLISHAVRAGTRASKG